MASKRSSNTATEQAEKKFRESLTTTATEFICPICHDLPLDPVLAEDGRIYNRECIQKWLQKKRTSPLTNEQMGNSLRPAPQVKAALESIVRSDALAQSTVGSKWKSHVRDVDNFRRLQQQAEDGKSDAMHELGDIYYHGTHGIEEDTAKAFDWYSKAATKGLLPAMHTLGWCYAHGQGVQQSDVMAMYWWRGAATKGCEESQICLGFAFRTGSYGVPPDSIKAHTWFKMAATRSSTGMLFLGCCYKFGFGVAKNSAKAKQLWTEAAAHEEGSLRASKILRQLNDGQRIDWPEDIFSDDGEEDQHEEGDDIFSDDGEEDQHEEGDD